ncbi:MAG: PH domain-containing protein [Pirellulales bacterium]|nr:PH domain-containing protein [Pirellulales bacterium]
MKCPSCGVEVVEKAVFCHHCGARLNDDQSFDSSEENGAGNYTDSPHKPSSQPNAAGGDESTTKDSNKTVEQDVDSTKSNAERLREAMGTNSEGSEDELWEGGYSVKAMTGSWILGGILSVCIVGLGIFFWSKGWLQSFVWWGVFIALVALWGYLFISLLRRRLGVHYRLTSQRFFHEKGILRHTTDLIEVIDMDDITFEQTLIDRMVGVGSIRIVSSDRSHPELLIDGIENVKEVAAKLHDARHAERLRRGLHIESI